jgi:23S rRNA (cytosine1962-C5)-methyltransferase
VLARAAYSPKSQIRARVWSFDAAEQIDAGFLPQSGAEGAGAARSPAGAKHTNALRLINGESDRPAGLVVDRYADVLVAQFLAAGVEQWRDVILDSLDRTLGLRGDLRALRC